jgi:prepilin-type N-terminal cleavage/methylation domain-containing protein
MKKVVRGFTLIELVIVIGILSVLFVIFLVLLGPAEVQKKARDVKRMKEAVELQSLVLGLIHSEEEPICTGADGCTSTAAGSSMQAQSCDNNWLNADMCSFTNRIPVEPANNTTRSCVNGQTIARDCGMVYRLKMSGNDYEINVRQESRSNENNVVKDGGDSDEWVELGTNLILLGD